VLVPALAQGGIVVMDNSRPPGRPTAPISTRSILRQAQEVLAKLEHFLRKAADERTAAATGTRIGTLLDDFSPAERANYFVNSGYASA
jgi:predicted O-methyltransferase YrrM